MKLNISTKLSRFFILLTGACLIPASYTYADQVILDDLIVDGSICAGQDCVNGESFGFDTIRIKENNLRIRAQDTSTSSSFPSNDWQLTFNDSSDGGANKFSIDDIDGGRTPFTLEAGAPSHSLYVDDAGRIGIGTSTPVATTHMKNGNTPTMRLEQDGSSGFTAQTWDVAGNEANFFVRDATNGSTLPLRIFPGAPTNSFTIEGTTGDIGVGTTSPAGPLHVKATGDNDFVVSESGNVGVGTSSPLASLHVDTLDAQVLIDDENTTSGTRTLLKLKNKGPTRFDMVNTETGVLWKFVTTAQNAFTIKRNDQTGSNFVFKANGVPLMGIGVGNPTKPIEHSSGANLSSGGVWTNASSRVLKEDIREISHQEATEALKQLQPVTYMYKTDSEERYAGFIAEDVPEIVAQNDRKTLSPMDVVAVLTQVVKDQNEMIEDMHELVGDMQSRLDRLEKIK